MRKIVIVMLLLLLATCVAFAEDVAEPAADEGVAVENPAAEPETLPPAEDPMVNAFGMDEIDLGTVEMAIDDPSAQYEATGAAIKPPVVLTYAGEPLIENQHYKLSYKNEISPGMGTVIATAVAGSGYTGTHEVQFKIVGNLGKAAMTLSTTSFYETGKAITPAPVLKYDETTLKAGTDYTLSYTNNVKVGTATVTATAKDGSNYIESKSTNFTIKATVPLSKVTMTLSKKKFYKTGKAIKPAPVLKYGETTLKAGTDYTLSYVNNVKVGTATVKAVFKSGGKYAAGSKSLTFTIVPAKPKAAAITAVKSSKPTVNVTWKKVKCTGYELQVSTSSNFKKVTKYKLKATTKKVPKLKNNKKYYFRVRAYNTENKKTTYGAWSKSSAKVKTTGEVGNRYSRNGAYIKNETIKIDGNSYYYNKDGLKSGCSKKMWDKVKDTSSKTKYLIAVDCSKNRTCVFEGKKGSWKLRDYWKCTTGKKSTPTIKGKFKVCGKVSHFGEQKGYSVWYATRIKYEYYFHSILYKPWSKSSVLSGTLGKNKSHGCIRLKLKNAKWIYNNCKGGTKIVIY